MLTLRQRIFIYISLSIGLVLVFLLFFFLFSKKTEVKQFIEEQSGKVLNTSGKKGEEKVNTVPAASTAEVFVPQPVSQETYAKQAARLFVERFASFSNQNANQHLTDVLPLATAKMGKWVQTQTVVADQHYLGVTTQVIASSVDSISADKATVKVDVQQEKESKEGVKVEQRSGRVELLKDGEEWKVDGLFWNE